LSIFEFPMALHAIVAHVVQRPNCSSRADLISLWPAVHATQAASLVLVMLYAVSCVARPIG